MQIGKSTYIDIKVKGLNKTNFLTPQNLKGIIMVETAGASLPYVGFSFFSTDKDIIEYFIENNKRNIELSIGSSKENSDKFSVQLVPTPKNTDGSDATATITAGGFLGSNAYMMDKGECKSYNGNSLLITKQVIARYTDLNSMVDTDITTVKENQVVWRQLFETTSNFLVRVLLHMNIKPSFPLFTFDKYGQFHVHDFEKTLKAGYKFKFTPFTPNKGEIQYLNNFNVKSYKPSYNLYSGYNKITEIHGVEKGIPSYVLADNNPILASTSEAERSLSGNRISLNKVQSSNVHHWYMSAFAHNTNSLVSLSSMQGVLVLAGYHPELKPTDLVYVQTPKSSGMVSSVEGNYLIDTIVFKYEFGDNIPKTYVYVTRDNNNNIENFVTTRKKGLKILGVDLETLADAVARTRTALATCSQAIDGGFVRKMQDFITTARNSLLRSFSVDGIRMDFTSQARMVQSLLCWGNNLMNVLVQMLFPENVANTLQNFLLSETSLRGLVGKYIYEYVPYELQGLISDLVDSMCDTFEAVDKIAEDNGITVKEVPKVANENLKYETDDDDKVGKIIEKFENNTTGLDIPFPIIELTESQNLLTEKELEVFVANETIANLTNLGYLEELTEGEIAELEEILLGEREINFALIEKINRAAGNKLNYRFWGTYGASNEALYAWRYKDILVYTKTKEITEYTRLFNNDYSPYLEDLFKIIKVSTNVYEVAYLDQGEIVKADRDESEDVNTNALSQLTDFYINKGYKDRYRTLPCTKLISATKNARLYFACPQTEKNIKFYINSRRVELQSFPIDLGYKDVYGNRVMYNVFYTTMGYNSNSVMLEIRQ